MRHITLAAMLATISLSHAAFATDTDSDGIEDDVDNCTDIANNQFDADLDGYGNPCDCDFDGNGSCTGSYDGAVMALCTAYQDWPDCAGADMDGDGTVDSDDLDLWYASSTPGPSGLSCAGTAPCALAKPLSSLPVVQVYEEYPYDGTLDQDDIDAALTACGSGCNLLFLADTYEDVVMEIGSFANGFAMYGYGQGKTKLRAPLFDETSWAPTIYVTDDAPDGDVSNPGVIIQGMTLDGRKNEQTPVVDEANTWDGSASAMGILTGSVPGPYAPIDRSHGEIRDVEVHDYVKGGIDVINSPDWIIENSHVHHIGCHQVNEACGCALAYEPCEDLGWNDLDDEAGSIPGTKVPGNGIIITYRSHDVVVRNNELHDITKMGISAFGPDPDGCADLVNPPHGVLIQNNEVSYALTGFAINGGCGITFDDNHAHHLEAPSAGNANTGKGFTCGANGDGSVWVDNIAEFAHGSGFDIGCTDGNLTFVGNISHDNCQGVDLFADMRFKGSNNAPEDWVDGMDIDDPTSGSPLCSTALHIENRTGVTVDGGTVTGGTLYGIQVRSADDVVIQDLDLTSSSPAGSDVGVRFDYTHQEPELEPLSNVFVYTTTSVSGFDSPVGYHNPGGTTYYTGDGDSVAVCGRETTPPEGCDNYVP